MKPVMPAHSEAVERYTPAWIFEGLGVRFSLDPCAPLIDCPSKHWCDHVWSLERGWDGLREPWGSAFVWLNPPWTRGEKRKWVMKLAEHRNGIALVRGGIDSAWLHDSCPDAVFLLRGRVKYLRPEDEPERLRKGGAVGGFEPSMLLGFGPRGKKVLRSCSLDGMYFEVPA